MEYDTTKFRKKMYKAGKFWVAAGAMFIGMIMAGPVQADQTTLQPTESVEVTQNETTTDSQAPDSVTSLSDSTVVGQSSMASVDSNNVAISSSASEVSSQTSSVSSSVASSATMLSAASSASASIAATTTDGYHDEGGNWVYYRDGKKLTGRQLIDTFNVYFDKDGHQVKGDWRETDGKQAYYDGQEGRALTETQVVDGVVRGFDADGYEITNGFGQTSNRDTYYFDNDGNYVTGIQVIDGQTYNFDDQGRMLKGLAAEVNGTMMYFDDQTGVATPTSDPKFSPELEPVPTENAQHNAAHGTTPEDFDNMAGYLTADTWYRPNDILD
ncbi:MAG: KxYKxGKxW signal peptide domain-containing protein, partial [Weissella confusa]|nr:KxYKxGKxW signal peptide domain-containing protein [Weissella confusa]